MPVYVDQIFEADPMLHAGTNPRQAARHGTRWCHLWADTAADVEELHRIAGRIGLKRAWFQNRAGFPHYDLVPSKRRKAIESGAVEIELMEWIRKRKQR